MKKALLLILPLAAVVSCNTARIDKAAPEPSLQSRGGNGAAGTGTMIDKAPIEANQRKITAWMLANRQVSRGGRDVNTQWTIAVLYAGIFSLYEQTKDPRYLELVMALGDSVSWKIGRNRFFGDDQTIGQVYCDLYLAVEQRPYMIADFKAVVDEQIAMPDPGLGKHTAELYSKGAWSWCDGLFMAPPAWARLAKVTGERKYLDAMDEKYWKTYDYLYDKEERLFFRDDSYFDRREANGKKVFWSRGNGWVMAGLARLLDVLPKDYPTRQRYENLFKEMAGRIRELQQPDGQWRSSLLDPASYPGGETSGTAFYTYAFAWGVNKGLLDSKTYLPSISRAWNAMTNNINADGKLGWVQPIGQDPRQIKAEDTEVYAVGGYLLAGREILALEL
jgi:rhamnogalacturonyl hydrolase YesR